MSSVLAGGVVGAISLGQEELVVSVDGIAAGTAGELTTTLGSQAVRYPSALGRSLDLDVSATTLGLKTSYTVGEAAAGGVQILERAVLPPGWSAQQQTGAVAITDETGRTRAQWTGGLAFDSADPPSDAVVDVRLVRVDDAAATVAVEVDGSWLTDLSRRYPVRIDPQVTKYTSDLHGVDTWIRSGLSTPQNSSPQLHVGRSASGPHRTLLHWYMGDIPSNATVSQAYAELYQTSASGCSPRTLTGSRIVSLWDLEWSGQTSRGSTAPARGQFRQAVRRHGWDP